MSGISGKHGGHAKPNRFGSTKVRVTSLAAVTGAMVLSGGIAEGIHLHGHKNQSTADASSASNSLQAAGAATDPAANDVAARGTAADQVNRDASRVALSPTASAAPGAAPADASTLSTLPFQPGAPLGTAAAPAGATAPTTAATTAATTAPTTAPTTGATTAPKTSATPTKAPTTTAKPTSTASSTTPSSTGGGVGASPAEAKAIAAQIVPAGQLQCFSNVVMRESGWNIYARNRSSGAYGLGQALPGSKMATAGSDWANDATTQIKWVLSYMDGRYGSACGAWSFWQSHSWY